MNPLTFFFAFNHDPATREQSQISWVASKKLVQFVKINKQNLVNMNCFNGRIKLVGMFPNSILIVVVICTVFILDTDGIVVNSARRKESKLELFSGYLYEVLSSMASVNLSIVLNFSKRPIN